MYPESPHVKELRRTATFCIPGLLIWHKAKNGESKMKSTINKLACIVMALTLITGIFTGCKGGNTKFFLRNDISMREKYGSLPAEGTTGDLEYRILGKDEYHCSEKTAGFYVDSLEQPDSPLFLVVTSGNKKTDCHDIDFVDMGYDGSTLWILVREADGTGSKYEKPYVPCCAAVFNRLPSDIRVYDETGKEYKNVFE